jgi:hypothetical protein
VNRAYADGRAFFNALDKHPIVDGRAFFNRGPISGASVAG